MSPVRVFRFVMLAPLFAVGALFTLYGVFALTFNDRGGSTYVSLAGHRLDAHLVGGVSLAIGMAIVASAVALMRRGRLRS
jgi:hypothetical protein